MNYEICIIVIGFILFCIFWGIKSEKDTRRKKEELYKNYRKLYESGKIYENLDQLWRCLNWLAMHDKDVLFNKIWNDMSNRQKFLIILRQEKETAQRKKQEDSENNWQTSAYPVDDGDGGE